MAGIYHTYDKWGTSRQRCSKPLRKFRQWRVLLVLAVVLTFPLCGWAGANDHPAWDELSALYGEKAEGTVVQRFVKTYDLKEATKGLSGSFFPKHNGYTISYRDGAVSTIILKTSPWIEGYGGKDWKPYAHKLPCGIKDRPMLRDLVRRFGPSEFPNTSVWVVNGLRIWAICLDDGTVSELYISPAAEESSK